MAAGKQAVLWNWKVVMQLGSRVPLGFLQKGQPTIVLKETRNLKTEGKAVLRT
jgi:hypothetical protein